jgi:predicted nicotinamide N-methyase
MLPSADLIRKNLQLMPVPGVPGLRLYRAQPDSRLSRLIGADAASPYWAYAWGGGLALCAHIAAEPRCVTGLRVLDLGAGSGLVGLVALHNGAASAIAADIDPFARAACAANAAANALVLEVLADNLLAAGAPLPPVDLVLVGDLFYERALVAPLLAALRRFSDAGAEILIGDPFRETLPTAALQAVASYTVEDFGGDSRAAAVFTLKRN